MPIEGLSDVVRVPRLGKIHLGIKVSKGKDVLYPKATDYFVCPPEVIQVYGDKPKELDIMFPVEEPEVFAQQFLRAYSLSQGLVCIGTGIEAHRKVDIDTGAMADHSTKKWEWKDALCEPQDCPEYQAKRCRRVMNLQFLLPTVPGLGVYQVDTSSYHSIVNINSMIKMLKAILGRCCMIPLILALGPVEVSPPGITKKVVYIMHIKKNLKLAELARVAMLPPGRVLIPEAETEEPPDDLFPDEVIDDSKKTSPKARKAITEAGHDSAGAESLKPTKDEGLFGEEPEIPWADDNLMQAWQIVKPTVRRLNLTDNQVKRWFAHYNVEVTRADFDRVTPLKDMTNEMLSRFQDMLDDYEKKQREKGAA